MPQEIVYQHPCIPVMLELRQFDRADGSIKGAAVRVSPQVWAGIESRMVTVAD